MAMGWSRGTSLLCSIAGGLVPLTYGPQCPVQWVRQSESLCSTAEEPVLSRALAWHCSPHGRGLREWLPSQHGGSNQCIVPTQTAAFRNHNKYGGLLLPKLKHIYSFEATLVSINIGLLNILK